MPWSYDEPPAVAQNWTALEQHRCVDAANAVLEDRGSDQEAIYACIAAAGKGKEIRAMKTKTFRARMEFKAEGEPGEFTATFSTLNVMDHDGDVTLPGAFKDGQAVRISYWGHRWHDLPVGKGVIHSDEERAWVDGDFFLDFEAGSETYKTVKNLGELQEWSYGFDILKESFGKFEDRDVRFLEGLDVHEVSPVMLGAGIGTETTSIKGQAQAPGPGDDAGDGDDGQSDAGTDAGDVVPDGPLPSVAMSQIDILIVEG